MSILPRLFLTLLVSTHALAHPVNEPAPAAATDAPARSFTFTYQSEMGPFDADSGAVDIYLPLAASNEHQQLHSENIVASSVKGEVKGTIKTDPDYGNRYWHAQLPAGGHEAVTVVIESSVSRMSGQVSAAKVGTSLGPDEAEQYARFLQANSRVAVDDPVLEPIDKEIKAGLRGSDGTDNSAALARGIYDWVVDNVEYKKVGTGWGNGDTFWACSERYGNCTDFHSLFISLARTNEIPARFEMGFPVPTDRNNGTIGGYHCWVQFYLPETGWFPIDASEAFKAPEKREYYYGSHPEDRILFTTGRDIQLDGASTVLNYFIYPHVEVAGKKFEGNVRNTFTYTSLSRDVAAL